MKRILILLALLAVTASAQTPVCKIYGTVDSVAGPTSTLTTTRAQITVTRASKSGSLFLNTSRVFNADANGRIEFYAPRTVGTDTAVIHIRANFGDLAAGQTVYVPDADSAELRTLPRYTANPTFVVVAVPSGGGSGDTSLNGHPRLTRIENVEGQFTPSTSDSLQQVAANVFVARNVAEGKADADSVKLAFDRLGDRADADSLASVKTTADGAVQKTDTNALHAQKFAVINDSLLAVSLRATTTKNDLTAHIGTADAHLPSQTGQAGKVLGTNGTVSAWQPEADPVYSAAAPTLRSKGDTLVDVRQTHLEMPNLTHILTADSNKTICVDGSGRLYLCWKGSGGAAATFDTLTVVSKNRADTLSGAKRFNTAATFAGGTIAGTGQPYGPITIADGPTNPYIQFNSDPKKGGMLFGAQGFTMFFFGNYSPYQSRLDFLTAGSSGWSFSHSYSRISFVANNHAAGAPGRIGVGVPHPKHIIDTKGGAIKGDSLITDSLIASSGTLTVFGNISAPNSTVSAKTAVADSLIANRNLTGSAYLRGEATVGAGDSVTVTVLGVAETDYITLGYHMGKTAVGAETGLSWSVWAANTLTIYGVQNRKVNYIRIM